MADLGQRTWSLTASALIVGAIVAQLFAKQYAGHGAMTMARATSLPLERLRLEEAASWHIYRSSLLEIVSFGFATLAVGSWVVSRKRREPGSRSVLPVLHLIYVVLLFLFV